VFKKILRRYGIRKEEVLYVGDEIRDITATKNIGVDIASVDWGYNSREGLEEHKPEYLISEPEELLTICLNHKE
jgi:phosphoglycolate phosphatase-like HAD superfamily hydrolase